MSVTRSVVGFFKGVFGVVVILATVLAAIYGSILLMSDVAPRVERVRRDVWQNTPSYINGKINELTRMRREYEQAAAANVKEAIRQEALASFATTDPSTLPVSLLNWLESIR